MANSSKIEWTEATWNPTTGCTKISEGCKNCYAEKLTKRLKAMNVKKYKNGFKFTHHPNEVDLPFLWKKPRKIFVNSMSDLFHESADLEFVAQCFLTMDLADWHQYQVLTKRAEIMLKFIEYYKTIFKKTIAKHIWLGVSVENQKNVYRVDHLRRIDCPIKFVSFEPLIGSVGKVDLTNIQWAIIGGESGSNYRAVREEWIQEIIEQCEEQKVRIFFKQWGGFRPTSNGRVINSRTYDEYPERQELKGSKHELLIQG